MAMLFKLSRGGGSVFPQPVLNTVYIEEGLLMLKSIALTPIKIGMTGVSVGFVWFKKY